MLKDIANLFSGFERARAPQVLPRQMSPMFYRPTQNQNYDVDFVAGAIQSSESGDITPLLNLYRDMEVANATIVSSIATRKLAVLARGFNVVAAENSGDAGQKIADRAKAMLEQSRSFVDACTWLLHGAIWPVSVVEKRWVPGTAGDFAYPEFRDVPLELYDYTQRYLRIKNVGNAGEPLTVTHVPDANRYIVHRGHMVKAPDLKGGPMRSLVFWFLFMTQDRQWWARFLERFGAPFMVGHYDKNDDESRLVLERAFQEATRLFGVVATRETEIDIKEGAGKADASSAFQMFHEAAKNEMLLVILGQTLSGNAQSTGLGSGTADLQGGVKKEYRTWDAFKLGNCIREDVIKPWMRLNGIKGPAPTVTFGGFDPADLAELGTFLKDLQSSGLELADDSIAIVSRHAGVTLQRKAAPAPMPGFGGPMGGPDLAVSLAAGGIPPVTTANEAIAGAGAADLRRAFSGDLAPLNEIVASSTSPGQMVTRATAFLAKWKPTKSQEILEHALAAFSANALVTHGKGEQD